MNRIILIGNGFDLAHGLPTRYSDFIQDYWIEWNKTLSESKQLEETDGLYSFGFTYKETQYQDKLDYFFNKSAIDLKNTYGKLKQDEAYIEFNYTFEKGKLHYKFSSHFFSIINKAIQAYNWVDIENEYYKLLKQIFRDEKKGQYHIPQSLNKELKILEEKLIAYLSKIQRDKMTPELPNNTIKRRILEPFNINDISVEGRRAFAQLAEQRYDMAQDELAACALIGKYMPDVIREKAGVSHYLASVKSSEQHIKNMFQTRFTGIPDYFLLPEDILFLNFNYTDTADLYLPQDSGFKVNHIHGKLADPDNPIIFGYGDELDEDYKAISNLNDNYYLENIKSIRYLETDNYRKLLRFIDSAPYQIYIMGHSCGNSDRTLLNTIFEHKNCISIKPFYHQKEDRTDNYIDIIQNISRDFNDMTLMRDRVVNKGYCTPLIPQ